MDPAYNLDKKAEEIYTKKKLELERKYDGKIVAIDLSKEDIIAIGEDFRDVYVDAQKKRPSHNIFLRKVGRKPEVARMRG